MRVLVVRKEITLEIGGAEAYALCVTRGLHSLGHEVHVLGARVDAGLRQLLGQSQVHSLEVSRATSAAKNRSLDQGVRVHLAGRRYDIVLGLSPFAPQDVFRLGDGVHAAWLAMRAPIRGLAVLNRLSTRHRAILNIERRALSPGGHRHVIAGSNMVRTHAIRTYGTEPGRISVIPGGVDNARFSDTLRRKQRDNARTQLRISGSDVVLLFAGNNFRRKGLAQLVDALALLPAGSAARPRLLVAGADKKGESFALLSRAARAGMAGRVRFLGRVNDMERVYAAADAFVLPTWYDPCSLATLEALSCGLPVVTTAGNGASELLRDGESGFVIPSHKNVGLLAERLSAIIDNDSLRERMSASAARLAPEISIGAHARRLTSLFEKLRTDAHNPLDALQRPVPGRSTGLPSQ